MSLMTLYMVCVALGGVLMGTSIFLGGHADGDADVDHDFDMDHDVDVDVDVDVDHDFDLDHDVDMDVDHDVDGHGDLAGAELGTGGSGFEWSVLPFGSLRFWTFLVESFGMTGALLSCAGVPSGATLGIALAAGVFLGWGAFTFFRWLAREEVSGAVALLDYKNSEARVLLRIPEDGRGKIAIETAGGRVELMARSLDKAEIARGDQVLVVGVKDGVAEVTALTPNGERKAKAEKQRAAQAARKTEKQL